MTRRRGLDRRLVVDELLPLLGLAGFGYALPLLDLLGTNPEFLVSHYLTGASLVVAALALATLPPLMALATVVLATMASERAGRVVWVAWALLFGTLAAGSLLRQVDLPSDVLQVLLAAAGGVAIVIAARRWRAARTGLAFLAATPLLAVLALVTWSPSAELVWQRDVGTVDGVEVARPAPVVVLQLDELPLSSLLRPDGTVNDERFPNFARLAGTSTWYQNAVAIAPNTTASFPAALTGTVPQTGELPTAADHPRNLFTLLGESYDLQVDEPVTALCPASLCGGAVDWGGLADDAVGVAGQLWLPPGLRGRLPSEVQRVADFENVDGLGGDSALQRLERAEAHVDALDAGGDRPVLWYEHVVLPHVPWALGHTGDEYRTDGAHASGPTELGGWDDDPTLARVGLQRHLLQVGASDRLLGRLLDRLEAEGVWDDALVVVLADHGAAFEPDRPYREPTTATAQEIYRIPLFVKQPGQTEGDVRTDLAYNVDVLPTVLDVLGADDGSGAELNGHSILEPVPDRAQDAALYVADGDPIHPDITVDQVTALAERNAALLPRGLGWHALAAVGPLGGDVGADVATLDVSATTDLRFDLEQAGDLAAVDTEATRSLPVFLWGTVVGGDGPADLLVALNGTVAGTLSRLAGDGSYVGVLDDSLIHQGENEVELLLPTGDGRFAPLPPANP